MDYLHGTEISRTLFSIGENKNGMRATLRAFCFNLRWNICVVSYDN